MFFDKTRKAYLMLFVTAFGWALSTIIIKMYIEDIPVFHLMFGRFFIAMMIIGVFNYKSITKIPVAAYKKGAVVGLMLFLAYSTAIFSLVYTSASKSGFLVALSVLFVPIVQLFIKRKLPNKWTVYSVLFSIVGLFLISGMNGAGFNKGDFLAVLCAVSYTIYILIMDQYTKEVDEISLVFTQLTTVTILSLIFAVFYDGWTGSVFLTGFMPIAVIAIFGTALSTFFQVKAQKYASPESVGLILLGEPLFTLIMAIAILGEHVMLKGLLGAGIILASLIITVIKEV